MDAEAIRAFMRRDRERVVALKRESHARRYRASRGTAGIEAGEMLAAHARRVRPDWPSRRDRALDLEHHVQLKRWIDRAAHAFTAR